MKKDKTQGMKKMQNRNLCLPPEEDGYKPVWKEDQPDALNDVINDHPELEGEHKEARK